MFVMFKLLRSYYFLICMLPSMQDNDTTMELENCRNMNSKLMRYLSNQFGISILLQFLPFLGPANQVVLFVHFLKT